jgi:predicted metal-dependent hydrolase
MHAPHSAPAVPLPRRMDFEFDDSIPRWWFSENPVATALANGLHLVFPEGERFFIRSVKHYMRELEDDPALQARIQGFFMQESLHGREHGHSFALLERQGYDVQRFLDFYERKWLPRIERAAPPVLRLAGTAALEHLTASLGEAALVDDLLEDAHPTFRALLRWHAAEEIEHKSVAFDVFQRVSGSYLIRVLGMALGLAGLLFFWRRAAKDLLRQEGLPPAQVKAYMAAVRARRRDRTGRVLLQAVSQYLRPSFHPDDNDNYHLAEAYLRQVGRLTA